jgi:DNA-binding NarL/FixJ family response regulator
MPVANGASGRGRAVKRKEEMPTKDIRCALLADRHLRLMEGVRGLLETEFEAVVVVGDEVSLFETARQLDVTLAVVDLSLARENGLGSIRRIRNRFPKLKLIALSVYGEKSVEVATIEAGANGFVRKGSIATDLLPTVDAVLGRSAT